MLEVCIKVFSSRAEAEIAKEILEEEDIDCYIVTDDGGGNSSPTPESSSYLLKVRKEESERAKKILKTQGGQGFKKP